MLPKPDPSRTKTRLRQIVGFSLSPDLAIEVKTEAARRNITLRKLFDEMWAHYKSKNKIVSSHAR